MSKDVKDKVKYYSKRTENLSNEDINERINFFLSTRLATSSIYKLIPNIDEILDSHFKGTHLEKKTTEKTVQGHSGNTIERLYAYINGISYCQECGCSVSFRNKFVGYNKFCRRCGIIQTIKQTKEQYAKTRYNKTFYCKNCGKPFDYLVCPTNKKKLERSFCCPSCRQTYMHAHRSEEQKKDIEDRKKKTCLERYGSEYVVNSQYTREKTKEKIGVDYAWKLENYGDICKEGYKKHHDGKEYRVSKETKEKIIKTKLEKYGSLLVPMYHYKTFAFPSGRTCYVQGYEDLAIIELLKTHDESDIIVERKHIEDEIGSFYYLDNNNEKHIYYPDIYIKSEKKVIEVKSKYVFNKHTDINYLKKKSVIERGYDFNFYIIEKQRNGTLKNLIIA